MTIDSSVWPAPAPTLSNNNISVYRFLNDTPTVEKTLSNMALQRMWADKVFDSGPRTDSGAVMYSQITGEGSYYTAQDVQPIAPGSEFPDVGLDEEEMLVATVTKWGGKVSFPIETISRDRRDILRRALRRLANTIARKVDTQAIAALTAAPVLTAAGTGDWGTAGRALKDLLTAISAIEQQDLGYTANICLLNPAQALNIMLDTTLIGYMPRETSSNNFVWGRNLDGIAGLRYIVTNRVADGTVWVVEGKTIGSITDERPFFSRIVDRPEEERKVLMAGRSFVPYVTDPKAAFKITGV